MKNIKKSFGLLLTVMAIITVSCKKENVNPSEEAQAEPTATFSNTNAIALINNLSTPLQTYTINTSSYHSFTCTNGTKINISPNAFLTPSGAPVTGVVTIEVKDILSKRI